jgi:serine protease Do
MKRWSFALVGLVAGAVGGTWVVAPVLQGQAPAQAQVAPAPKELYSYRDVVKRVLPAVVSIEAKTKAKKVEPKSRPRIERRNPQVPDDLRKQLPEEFRKFFEEFGGTPFDFREFPEQGPRQGFGSGFFIDGKGTILTNNHVVDGADQVIVTTHEGRKFNSKEVLTDSRTDLAVIRLDTKDFKGTFPFLEFGDSDAMEIGDRVLAVGAPFGLAGSVTHGIVSAKGRNGMRLNMYEDFIQTDAPINPGNSGGPLVSLEGQVIGVSAAIKTRSGGFQGVGLAIASNMAKKVSKSLLTEGVVRRGYLGVQIAELDPDVAARLGVEKGVGVVVGEVFENAPAAKGGLKPGDVITSIAGKPVKDGIALQTTVASLPLKKPVEVAVVRDGQAQALSVTIEEQPKEFGTARVAPLRQPSTKADAVALDKLGVEVTDLTDELAEGLGYGATAKGAVITKVEAGGLAAESGLRRGMLIRKVDKQVVTSAAQARTALENASLQRGVLLQVQSPQGGINFVLIKSSESASR